MSLYFDMAEQIKNNPKMRDDLIIQEVANEDGSKSYIIKDPITNAFFKVGEPEYYIISRFDGLNSIPQTLIKFKDKFKADLSEAEIGGFVDHLQNLCFLDNDLSRAELLKKQKEADENAPKTFLGKLLFFKLKAVDPGRFLNWALGYTKFAFSKLFIGFMFLSITFSLIITIYNGEAISGGIAGLLTVRGIVAVYLVGIAVIVIHEISHGLTCVYYGGSVREIGFLMIYFQPAFYCDVSDAWLFPEKSKRLWVSASGALIQLLIWALATIVWRITQTDHFINHLALAIMAFSGISSIFNFNPLLRFDGYYFLSDYLEIPNLRFKVRNYWKNMALRFAGEGSEDGKKLNNRHKRIYFYYGVFSFLYIVFVLGYFFYWIAGLMISEWGGAGFLLFVAMTLLLFRNIIVTAAKETSGMLRKKRPLIITLVLIALFSLIVIFAKMELRIKGQVELSPVVSLILKYDNLGYAQLIKYDPEFKNLDKQREVSSFTGDYNTTALLPLVALSDTIKKGQTIARLANSEIARYLNDYTAQLQEAEEELAILRQGARPEEVEKHRNDVKEIQAQVDQSILNLNRMREMYEKDLKPRQEYEDAYTDSVVKVSRLNSSQSELDLLLAGSRPEEIRAKEAEIESIKSNIDSYQTQKDFSEIKSTIDGIVLAADTGEVVYEIAPIDFLTATITLSEKELADIELKQPVKLKVRSYPSESFYGIIYLIDEKVIQGPDGEPAIKVFCKIENKERLLKPGMTGVANVYCGKRNISYHIYRKFFRTLRTEFWDWFDWS